MKKRTSFICCMCVCTVLLLSVPFMRVAPFASVNADIAPDVPIIYFGADEDGSENTFGGEGQSTQANETIYYDTKTVSDHHIASEMPSYRNNDLSKTDVCANVAGANVCGYYDRWSTNLLPSYTPGITIGGQYTYLAQYGTAAQTCIDALYVAMNTNVDGIGTSLNGFKSGLSNYSQGKGYGVTYSALKQSTTALNMATLLQAVNNNRISVLFLTKYNFIFAMTDNGNSMYLEKKNYINGHVMCVYGYKTINYYRNGSLAQTDTYLYASSGYSSSVKGFMKMDSSVRLEEALVVYIA